MADAEAVLDVLDDAVDVSAEIAHQTIWHLRKHSILIGLGVFAAFNAGGALSYYLTKKKLTLEFNEHLEYQIDKTKEYYSKLHKKEEFATVADAADVLLPKEENEFSAAEVAPEIPAIIQNYRGEAQEQAPVQVVVNNVFTDAMPDDDGEWDYEREKADRLPDKPYIITKEEFLENEKDHEQGNLSYFAGDDILSDERDSPVDDTENTVGDDNLTRFGDGSGDKNILYIRNERIGMDWEIIRSDGTYTREVLGVVPEAELKHSYSRRNTRRSADE